MKEGGQQTGSERPVKKEGCQQVGSERTTKEKGCQQPEQPRSERSDHSEQEEEEGHEDPLKHACNERNPKANIRKKHNKACALSGSIMAALIGTSMSMQVVEYQIGEVAIGEAATGGVAATLHMTEYNCLWTAVAIMMSLILMCEGASSFRKKIKRIFGEKDKYILPAPRQVITRDVACQSQCTYRRDLSTPRFQVVPEWHRESGVL